MEKAKKIITKLTGRIMGYINPKNGEITYALNVKKGNNLIPFYFNSNGNKLIFPLDGQKQSSGPLASLMNAFDAIEAVDESDLYNYQEIIRNKNKLLEKFKILDEFYSNMSLATPMLYTQLTIFKFSRALLNTLRKMPLAEYESCGGILVSKSQKIKGKRGSFIAYTDREERETANEEDYIVLFNSSKSTECINNPLVELREIEFHTHPIHDVEETELANYLAVIQNLFSPPSIGDINIIIKSLSNQHNDVKLIFAYGVVYITRPKKLLHPMETLNMDDDTIDKLDENIQKRLEHILENEYTILYETYEGITRIAVNLLDLPYDDPKINDIIEYCKLSNNVIIYKDLISKRERQLDEINEKGSNLYKNIDDKIKEYKNKLKSIEKRFNEYPMEKYEELSDFIREALQRKLINIYYLSSSANLDTFAFKTQQSRWGKEIMDKMIQIYLKYINPSHLNLSDSEKINFDYLFAQEITFDINGVEETSIQYPLFSVQVYPRLQTQPIPPAIRRLSMA